jgi:hypothetical protein
MKIRPLGAELFHADGRTDMTKPIFPILRAPLMMRTTSITATQKQGDDSEQTSTDLKRDTPG